MSARLQPAYELARPRRLRRRFPRRRPRRRLDEQLALHPFGNLTRDAKSPAVTADTIYDVASLTKPIVTTTAIMTPRCSRVDLDLDAPVVRYLPEWAAAAKSDPDPSWRARVTVRMLLLHDSGLPAHRDFFLQAKTPEAVLARSWPNRLSANLARKSNTPTSASSCLAEIVQRLTGDTLDENAQDIFERLQMKNSLFKPPKNLRSRIAPTEEDTTYRKRLLQGEVHDENAYALGGVAGHAGLFSTAGDIAEFAQMMLNGGIYAQHRILRRSTINQFTARETIGTSARALGWDVPVAALLFRSIFLG